MTSTPATHTGDTDVAYGYVGPIAGPLFDQPDDVPHFTRGFRSFPGDLQKLSCLIDLGRTWRPRQATPSLLSVPSF